MESIVALSNKEILLERKRGTIVIEPFELKNLATSSYDVRLGEWYYREQESERFSRIYNPWNKNDVYAVWGKLFSLTQLSLSGEKITSPR